MKANQSNQSELDRCRDDIVYWVNTYCWTFDPREIETEPVIPFHLFPKQEEFLLWVQERESEQRSGLAEKSRDVGFTWLCCAYAVHGWLFRKGFTVGFGSRKVELVDRKGDTKSIFEKIRFLIEHLPDWQLPAGYNPRLHSGFCKLINPANGATVTGEGGDQVGRGGRASIYFLDEAAFLQHPDIVDRALSATTRVKIYVSTPNGPGNAFAIKRFGGKIPVFTFHWRDDPRKDDAWYAQQKEELDSVALAQEVDIDYTASIEGICIPSKWVRSSVNLIQHPRFKAIFPGFAASQRPVCGLDVAAGGKNKTVFIARRGILIEMPLSWDMNGTATAHRAADETEKRNGLSLNYDATGVGYAVQSAFESMERQLHFTRRAVLVGSSASEDVWPSGKTSKEQFRNLRAELYWKMRDRFEKTFEFVEQGIDHPQNDLISIPDDRQLIMELSMPLTFRTNTGLLQIESKEDMRKRGVASPDYADALSLTFVDGDVDLTAALAVSRAGVQRHALPELW